MESNGTISLALKGPIQGNSGFEGLYLVKESSKATCYYYRKSYAGSPVTKSV